MNSTSINRRDFVNTVALAGGALALGPSVLAQSAPDTARPVKLGFDNFAVRAMGWKAPQLIDYAASLKLDSLFVSDLDAFENLEEPYLKEMRQRAADKGLQIHVGTWSICPTSRSFRNNHGSAEEHLALGIRTARALGSPVIRVILGTAEDRRTPGGIEARIADTVKVCHSARKLALDSGVKIAVENHAGDMQAWELVQLVEAAGRDYVGVNLDSGNAAWTLEDPLESLEILGKYAATTSLRDSSIWESENGAKIQWAAMGEGQMDLKKYFERFRVLCPGLPVHIETISGFAREFPYLRPEFWDAYPKARARDFAKFLALAKKGKPHKPVQNPAGSNPKETEQLAQKAELERSLRYCKDVLGLGEKRG